MPNNLTTTLAQLTFDGVDLQRSDLSVHLDLLEGLNDGLDVRGEDTVIPTARGRVARNRKADMRHLLLAGLIQGEGSSEALRLASWQSIRDELEATFDPEGLPATLSGVALDGSTRTIEARTVSSMYAPSEVPGVGTISFQLEAAEPDWQVTPESS